MRIAGPSPILQGAPAAGARAAIDLGSSSAKLLVEQRRGAGWVTVLDLKIGCALGKDVGPDKVLPASNQQRALEALKTFVARAAEHGVAAADIPVIMTAVVRNTVNGAAFAQRLAADLKLSGARVLSGQEEADYGFRGAIAGVGPRPGERLATLDLGGGSFQLAIGTSAGMERGGSTQKGSNYVLEQLLAVGRITPEQLARADRTLVAQAPMPLAPALLSGRRLVATGGVSKFLRAHFGRDTIQAAEIEALRQQVSALDVDARVPIVQRGKDAATLDALGVKTAEGARDYGIKLPASTTLLLHIMRSIGVTSVTVSSTDARHALTRG